jgi:hypothetical protein
MYRKSIKSSEKVTKLRIYVSLDSFLHDITNNLIGILNLERYPLTLPRMKCPPIIPINNETGRE